MNTTTANTTATPTPNKGFGTGKGTTARIKGLFDTGANWTVKEAGVRLGLPSRQLHKRFAELVKAGYLTKSGEYDGAIDYAKVRSV